MVTGMRAMDLPMLEIVVFKKLLWTPSTIINSLRILQNLHPTLPSLNPQVLNGHSCFGEVLASRWLWRGGLFVYMEFIREVPLDEYGHEITEARPETNVYEYLARENESFYEAEQALRRGDVAEAEKLYRQALETISDPYSEGQIFYKISLAQTFAQPERAIETLKQIIENETYTDVQRAYATQRLALLYYRYSKPELFDQIFAGDRYQQFVVEGDVEASLNNLFEYASSFEPLAVAELRSAVWYSEQLLDGESDARDEYLDIIDTKLENATFNISELRLQENASSLIPEALYLRARLLVNLHALGIEQDYELALEEALGSALASGVAGSDGSARYMYAIALLQYEEGREEDINRMIQPFIDNIDSYVAFKRFFEREKGNVLGQQENLIALSDLNPNFKELLTALGWGPEDFIL